MTFDGDREGGRPVLRVSTSNNMVSARVRGAGAERWSDAAVPSTDATISDHALMRRHPWLWAIMGKELLREGKAVTGPERTDEQLADPRRYAFLAALDDASRASILAAGGLEFVKRGGDHVFVPIRTILALAGRGTAIELPIDLDLDAVIGVASLGVEATVLDAAFRPRLLELVAAAQPLVRRRRRIPLSYS